MADNTRFSDWSATSSEYYFEGQPIEEEILEPPPHVSECINFSSLEEKLESHATVSSVSTSDNDACDIVSSILDEFPPPPVTSKRGYPRQVDLAVLAPPVPEKGIVYKAAGTNPSVAKSRIWTIPEDFTGVPKAFTLSPKMVAQLELAAIADRAEEKKTVRFSTVSVAKEMPILREILFVATVCMAQLCTQIGMGQTLALLHVIGDHFGVSDPVHVSWWIAGYSLTIGTFILLAGRLGDTFGHKLVFLSGFVWTAIWAAVSGAAIHSGNVLFTISRVFQGIGFAMCLPNAISILEMTYAKGKRKCLVFGIFAAMYPVGFITGAACGSALALVWWPLGYWVFAVVLCLVAVFGYFTIPVAEREIQIPSTLPAAIMDLDIPGASTGIFALVLISFAFIQGPVSAWVEPAIWLGIVAGFLLLGLFVFIECYYATNPLVPFRALSASTGLVLTGVACGWACFGIWLFYTWQFLQIIRNLSPLVATAWFIPIVVVGIFTAFTTGIIVQQAGPRLAATLSMLALTLGTALVASVPENQVYWGQIFVSMCLIAWGTGVSFPASTILVSSFLLTDQQPIAASLVSTIMYYSISLGIGIGGTVQQKVVSDDATKAAVLDGLKAALWTGVVLAGIAAFIGLVLILKTFVKQRRKSCRFTRRTGVDKASIGKPFNFRTQAKWV